LAQASRYRTCTIGTLVHRTATARLHHLLHLCRSGDEPRPLRPARSRIRTHRRLSHRIQQHEVGALLPGRVYRGHGTERRRHHAILWRLERALRQRVPAARHPLVRFETHAIYFGVYLDARHLAAPALRPTDALWLESPDAARRPEPDRHRRPCRRDRQLDSARRNPYGRLRDRGYW